MARILILEDEKAINDLVALNLGMIGHTAVQAFTGREALKAAAETPFDLLILDVMLPDTNGFAVCEKLRDIPAIFLTRASSAARTITSSNRSK